MTLPAPELLIGLYLLCNLAAFVLYGRDKRKAELGRWRTSERTLLAAAAVGPFGAWAGMRRFRHKTQKSKFLLVPAFLILHAAIIGWLAYAMVTAGLL